ncbi:MAG: type II toxin-antitoxin system VapC family toxin [Pseudomonadota bacterium]|nr:type II toxin-antitoxin system VapC family toxin [Pseudomonadota bacterium]
MKIICDTHALLFWADQRHRLTPAALGALEAGRDADDLACSDISLWEIAILFRKGRLVLPAGHAPAQYMDDIVQSLRLSVLPITPAIAARAESGIVPHGDPADRLIAATTLVHNAALITADEKLRALPGLHCVW